MPCARPQAAEIVEAAQSAVGRLFVANQPDEASRHASTVADHPFSEPDDELSLLVERWTSLPRDVQSAILALAATHVL